MVQKRAQFSSNKFLRGQGVLDNGGWLGESNLYIVVPKNNLEFDDVFL